jgi:CheY-like chemotaxis protein
MRILIIDDDRDIREILGLLLAAEGYEVDVAVDGVAGLARVQASHPSLVLLDLMMPRLDGEGFLRAFRTMPHTADIPVVVLTGHPGGPAKAAKLGAAGFLSKPVELADLLSTIRRFEAQPVPLH